MLQLVIWGYREYFMDYGKTVRIAELSIDNFSEAACPEDMVNWTSLYYQTEKGAKYTFVQDDSIALPNDDKNRTVPRSFKEAMPELSSYFVQHYGKVGRYFQHGVLKQVKLNTQTDLFRYDRTRNKFVFRQLSDPGKMIFVEYITDGLREDDEALVHPYALEPLLRYAVLEYRKSRPRKYTNFDVRVAQEDYDKAMEHLRSRNLKISFKRISRLIIQSRTY